MLADLLAEKQEEIVAKWREVVFSCYPAETQRFFRSEKDRFANPIAYQVSRGIKLLYAALLRDADASEITPCLDEIISVKALQESSPAQALAFIFLLKNIIRSELAPELQDPEVAAQCLEWESRLDGVALLGFEVYMKRRERLSELRVEEMRRWVGGLMRRAGLHLDLGQEFVCSGGKDPVS